MLEGRQFQITGRTTFDLLDLFFSAAGFFLGCLSFGCLGFGGRRFQIMGRRPLGFKFLVFLATSFFSWFLFGLFRLGWVGSFKLEEHIFGVAKTVILWE
jgi:hypothetical protein